MTDRIIFVTGNGTKVLHAQEALKDSGIRVVNLKLDLIEPREEEPEKVAEAKAVQALEQIHKPLIVEDAGIFIQALNGFPKAFIHFAEETIGIAGILKLLEGATNRSAEFRQSLAYIESGMDVPKIFSYIDGGYRIADRIWEPKYESGEFDRILIPPGENQPLCMFDKEWRAKRDTEANKETIHYRQLTNWLEKR
jgi:XTP/dITP diphosphohydrolase